MATYQFYLESCEIMDTRSFHEDTIVAGLGVVVNDTIGNRTLAAQVGDHNNGKFAFWQQNLGSLDRVEIGPDDYFAFIYQLYNNGQAGRPTVSDVEAYVDRDLLSAANDLKAVSNQTAASQVHQFTQELARLESEIQNLLTQLQMLDPKPIGTAADQLGAGDARRVRLGATRSRDRTVPVAQPSVSPREALTEGFVGKLGTAPGDSVRESLQGQLKALQNQKIQAVTELAKAKADLRPPSLTVLMPGTDWRNDGPFTSGDYSVKNYSRGKLISILGNIVLAGCDGPLAFGFVAGTGAELDRRIPTVGPLRLSGEFKAGDLGWGAPCNPSGSHYVVNTIIQRQ